MKQFEFRGGHLALDFINTVGWRLAEDPGDLLESYDDLLDWSGQAGVLDHRGMAAVRAAARRSPAAAARALRRAIRLRELCYRLFDRRMHGKRPAPADLAEMNRVLGAAARGLVLGWTGDRLAWTQRAGRTDLASMLGPLARAAADLLTSEPPRRVAQCHDDRGCGWLFLDASRMQSRQWCSMADCGNRAKARRHYRRAARSAGKRGGGARRS